MEIAPFGPEHLDGVIALFQGELWLSYLRDRECTCRALQAPGSTALVALDGHEVVGLAHVQSDGEIQAHLSTLVVAPAHRRQGIGRRLVREGLDRAGGERLDLISVADDFYAALGMRRFSGWRLTRADLGLGRSARA